jgi:UPF0042 nucleotide-binding protein
MLKVRINSFSYKKSGIPKDDTPNGGGFVFDCRFIFNPGRIKEFVELNGSDRKVIEYLDNQPDMQEFLKNAFSILSLAINNYLTRNFTDIMISFGCTGGQHRSVYAAEKTKEFLKEEFNGKIQIQLNHIEFSQISSQE